jgi:TonB-like protein
MRAGAVGSLAVVVGLGGTACAPDASGWPEPRPAPLQFVCYPAQYLRPLPMPSFSRKCPLTHPERANKYVVALSVDADGTMVKATVRDENSPETNECALSAVNQWKLEPARTCMGEAVASEYDVDYSYLFGYLDIHWWEQTPAKQRAGGRTER